MLDAGANVNPSASNGTLRQLRGLWPGTASAERSRCLGLIGALSVMHIRESIDLLLMSGTSSRAILLRSLLLQHGCRFGADADCVMMFGSSQPTETAPPPLLQAHTTGTMSSLRPGGWRSRFRTASRGSGARRCRPSPTLQVTVGASPSDALRAPSKPAAGQSAHHASLSWARSLRAQRPAAGVSDTVLQQTTTESHRLATQAWGKKRSSTRKQRRARSDQARCCGTVSSSSGAWY